MLLKTTGSASVAGHIDLRVKRLECLQEIFWHLKTKQEFRPVIRFLAAGTLKKIEKDCLVFYRYFKLVRMHIP